MPVEGSPSSPDLFDRALGNLIGLPDVASTKPTTIRAAVPLVGNVQTFIVQSFRQRDADAETTRDTVFVECANAGGMVRMVIPHAVADAIARQRDALSDKTRSKAAKRVAEDRKAAGVVPAFLRTRKVAKKK